MVDSAPRGIPRNVLENDVKKLTLGTGDSFWRRLVESLSVVEFCNEVDEARIKDAFRPRFLGKHTKQPLKHEPHGEEATVEKL